MKQLFSAGNHKLGKTVLSFSIPASKKVCGRECAGCYAIKAQKQYKQVLPYREACYDLTLTKDFVRIAVEELKSFRKRRLKVQPKYVRIHQSGEFYSQEYIDKWVEIIKANPDYIFYAYTKRLREFDFTEFMALPNAVLKDSYFGGKVNFGDEQYIDSITAGYTEDKDYFVCPDYQTKEVICGLTCTKCMDKSLEDMNVLFLKH